MDSTVDKNRRITTTGYLMHGSPLPSSKRRPPPAGAAQYIFSTILRFQFFRLHSLQILYTLLSLPRRHYSFAPIVSTPATV